MNKRQYPKDFEQLWRGRVDHEDGELGRRVHQVVRPFEPSSSTPGGITLAGLASDLGVQRNQGRVGASEGPVALRRALANLAWHFECNLYDAGDTVINQKADGDPLANAQSQYAATVASGLAQRQFVIGLGGGHEIAWGSYQGCRQFLDQRANASARIGVLNFDAHLDLRKPPQDVNWVGSSGTPFYQIAQDCQQRGQTFNYACIGISQTSNTQALFRFADQHRVEYVLDEDCTSDNKLDVIETLIQKIDCLYVTVCLDVMPGFVAPGVSAPAALGIPLAFILNALQLVEESCQHNDVSWLMADIAELNPTYDQDSRTARTAARLAYEMIRLKQRRWS